MGGIADYSGSLVLQLPTREAVLLALQIAPEDPTLRVVSLNADAHHRSLEVAMAMGELWDEEADGPISYEAYSPPGRLPSLRCACI